VEGDALVNAPLESSSWHRVAGLRASLVPGLRVVRQAVRGQVWHLLVEPGSGRQLRLNPAAYALVGRFDGGGTLQELWQRQLAQQRADAPTQDEVLQLVAQLFRGGMLRFDAAPNLSLLFARREQDGRQRRRGMMNPLAIRLPLADPARLLQALAPLARALFRPATFVLWLAAVLLALLAAGAHFSELQAESRRLLATPSNYVIAWLCYPAVKLLHELAHALAVRRYGGEVHELGISLVFLTPAPYVDASAASAFGSRRERFVVSVAGILVETGIAAVALGAWLALSPGLVRDTLLVVTLICSVSTLLFNANPLVRFDGYHALCDALQLPNLAMRSQAWWSRRWHALLERSDSAAAPLLAPGEAKWLAVYAPAALVYRVLLLAALVFWIGGQSWLLGWAAALLLLAWGARQARRWLQADAGDRMARRRALQLVLGVVAALAVLLFAVPAPDTVVARGIVWPPDNAQLRAGAGGFVERLELPQGAATQPGQLLVVLQDPVLVAARERLDAERSGLQSEQYQALLQQPARAAELAEDLLRNEAELARVDEQLAQLELRARLPGEVAWARPQDLPGSFVKRGELLGHVLTGGPAHLRIALLEDDYLRTRGRVRALEVRLADTPGRSWPGRLAAATPGATTELPSPALGDRFGGPVPVDPADAHGLRARVPVFLLDAEVPGLLATSIGSRAWVKLVLPPQALGLQWLAQARQLLLKQFTPTGQL
jgi:putative peptide zinc metalloprotease protein